MIQGASADLKRRYHSSRLPNGIDLHDVGVPQPGNAARFLDEALAELDGAGDFRRDDLDGDWAIERFVVCEKDCAHTALSEQAVDAILAAEGGGEALLEIG